MRQLLSLNLALTGESTRIPRETNRPEFFKETQVPTCPRVFDADGEFQRFNFNDGCSNNGNSQIKFNSVSTEIDNLMDDLFSNKTNYHVQGIASHDTVSPG